jgi:hypothetical protein
MLEGKASIFPRPDRMHARSAQFAHFFVAPPSAYHPTKASAAVWRGFTAILMVRVGNLLFNLLPTLGRCHKAQLSTVAFCIDTL